MAREGSQPVTCSLWVQQTRRIAAAAVRRLGAGAPARQHSLPVRLVAVGNVLGKGVAQDGGHYRGCAFGGAGVPLKVAQVGAPGLYWGVHQRPADRRCWVHPARPARVQRERAVALELEWWGGSCCVAEPVADVARKGLRREDESFSLRAKTQCSFFPAASSWRAWSDTCQPNWTCIKQQLLQHSLPAHQHCLQGHSGFTGYQAAP